MNSYLKKIVCFVLLCSALGTFVPKRSFASGIEYSYIANLSSSDGLSQLEFIGESIKPVFPSTTAKELKNWYSFTSKYPYEYVQSKLSRFMNSLSYRNEYAVQTTQVSDPGFTTNYEDIDRQWGLVKAGFVDAWENTTGSTKNVIAVIDTGIDATHEDLKDVLLAPGYDFINNKVIYGRDNTDDNGHGTLVAGVIAATPNNAKGVVGANWSVTLMPIKALDFQGKGDSAGIAQSIVWAVDNGARIINISLGGLGFEHDPALAESISYAFHKNAVIIAAAGNDVVKTGGNMDENPVFPICDDNDINMVIGVAASDQNDVKTDFSNFGKNCIDVVAPGKRILSTINHDPITRQDAPNAYAFASGTSLAVPFVSAQAALILAKYPNLSNIQVRDRIMATALNIDSNNLSQCGGLQCSGMLGAGRIQVQKSLEPIENNLLIRDGDLVKTETGQIFQIVGGQRRPVSPMVFNQRFSAVEPRLISSQQIKAYPEGSYATPIEGTLVKIDHDPTVYFVTKGMKLPVLESVFRQRGFMFSSVLTADVTEVDSWLLGKFLTPSEGVLLKSPNNKTLYWVIGETLHPVNRNFYEDQGLSYFPIFVVSDNDILGLPKGEVYVK